MERIQPLRVSDDQRFLIRRDGGPFFWLGDTAWELFHKLDREEAAWYLKQRAEQRFTVIQAVALAEFEGVTTDNAYGRRPFRTNSRGLIDPTLPDLGGDYDYWAHVDYIVDTAAEFGLYIAFLPTWGDKFHQAWGKGPEIFDADNARWYGRWLGERYKHRPNLIWVLGGDRPLATKKHCDVVTAMAEGLRSGDGGSHLITFHPVGKQSSSFHLHEAEWLDFNMVQSGHDHREIDNYVLIGADYGRHPVKPVLDGEPCYEDHPRGFKAENGYFDAADVRKAAYYALLSGAFGHTYGHHSIWSMTTEPDDYFILHWKNAVMRPGALQMRHVRALMEARPFLERIPDQSLIVANYAGANYMTAARGRDHAMIYSPNGLAVRVKMGKIAGSKVRASWFDPRTGQWSEAGNCDNAGEAVFHPPTSGRGCDWVLVLDGDG